VVVVLIDDGQRHRHMHSTLAALSPTNPAPMTTRSHGCFWPEWPRLCGSDGRAAALTCDCMIVLTIGVRQ
jgi:hypothetical protein